jgi:hypothetical protein
MDFAVHPVGNGSDEDVLSLMQWLRQERLPSVRLALSRRPAAEGTMGLLADAVQIIGPDGAAAAVATAISAWLASRRTEVKIRIRRKDGSEIEVEQRGGRIRDDVLNLIDSSAKED